MKNNVWLLLLAFLGVCQCVKADVRDKYNFNSDWLLYVGDVAEAKEAKYADADWKKVTLPRPFNEDEAFKLDIHNLTDTIMWYRKHFRLPAAAKGILTLAGETAYVVGEIKDGEKGVTVC